MPSPLTSLRSRLARAGDYGRKKSPLLRRVPPMKDLIELAARIGYGARGFVYLSVGLLTLLASIDLIGDAVGTKGAIAWMALRPLGRLWLLLVGLGLTAFVMWRTLQAVFDADHEGTSRHGLMTRMSQAFSGLSYAFLAFSAFALLLHTPEDPAAADLARSQEQAETVLALPWGNWLLAGAGLVLLGIGVANVSRAWREDFTEYLACSEKTCRRVAPLARAGVVARGLAYVPLAFLIVLAGLRSSASDVTTFGSALDVVERQPGGPWILGLASLGFIAFGAFSFIEARFRRIRPPRDLSL
ncbi:DUF1206 domain-containing protein [Brevundimonas sp.]|uniref:DUF1206 domain-containing protein n=1 Tax=Brevundimonas sp. TaxID=1871086 RepID=UPI002FCB2025